MRSFIVLLLIFIVSVCVGLKIAEDPGFAYFSYHNWSVEMPLWFAVVSLLILFFFWYVFMRILEGVELSVYRWKNWLRWRRKNKSYSKTNRGLVELIQGNWKAAEEYLLEGIPQADEPLINYLAAANAAQHRKAFDKRDAYLQKALDIAPHAELPIGLTQAQLLFEQGQYEQALATLAHLRTNAPKQKAVLKLLERVYMHLGEWQELLKLLPSLRKAKVVESDEMEYFEKKVYVEILRAMENKKESEITIHAIWKDIPRRYQKDPELICEYVRLLLPYPAATAESEELLRKAMKHGWNKEAVRLYGLVITTTPAKQLTKAESWLADNPNQPSLFLTLARLAMRSQLWGKARDYYNCSLKLEVSPETYVEYGNLLEILGEQTAAIKTYREGLVLKAATVN